MPVDGWIPLLGVPALAVAAWAVGAVRFAGAVVGALVGLALAAGLGWTGFAMLAALVGIGTLASERGARDRDWMQVVSNGGVAAVAAILGGAGVAWGAMAAAGALAASLSDTVAGEWGRRLGGPPRLLLIGPRTERGRDGGMSWLGTCAGVLFAWPVPLIAWGLGGLGDFRSVSAVAAAGFAGNLADSVLGVTVQARLGARGNDWVNLIATGVGAGMAALAS